MVQFIQHLMEQRIVRRGLIALFLIGNYWLFFGFPDLSNYYARSASFTVPAGYNGSLVVGVYTTVRPDVDSGIYRLPLDRSSKEQILNKAAYFIRANRLRNALAYCIDRGLYAMDQSGKETKLAEVSGFPVWSPDGNWIVCTHSQRLSTGNWKQETWKYKVDGSTKELFPAVGTDSVRDWSADGRWMLVWNPNAGSLRLLGTTDDPVTVPLPLGIYAFNARFSPDGTKVLYIVQGANGNVTICSRDLVSDGQSMKVSDLTTYLYTVKNRIISDYSCSQDGEFLAVATNDRIDSPKPIALGHLQLINVATGKSDDVGMTKVRWINSLDFQ